MDVANIIAANVKSVREEKKLTLDMAAELTGVSRSMLAQIEKGDVNPTITVLWKIANGYKVSFTSLVESKAARVDLIKSADAQPLVGDNGRFVNYPVFPFNETRLFESYRIVIAPQGVLASDPHLKGAEEYITVFAGQVEIAAGDERYRLGKGDSIRFHADTAHSYQNSGDVAAELSMIIRYGV